MVKKAAKGLIVTGAIVIIPAFGNIHILKYPHLWILLALGLLASILQPDYNVMEGESKGRDRGTEIQIIWSVFVTQLLVIMEAAYVRFPISVKWDTVTTVSLAVMILGLLLRTWSVFTLGRHFTMHLAIQQGHKVIRSGPYRFFRHPSYVGAFFTYVGTPVFLHAWYSLVPTMLILTAAWVRRIRHEEKMLLAELGEEYGSYSREVKRAIPGIW